ncbi:AAA family ATPase [Pyrobaculum arsenaticum]|uniref:AAA family ATPase n=2 Tax=Pyrobaculum arsenaticum TaxID=121277 RepID=A0A7L4PBC4_9CREN|nr:family 417, putative ATP binding protein [Pyrobaculum arsenaticum DSM 13514]NYR16279.1 AAA family ATPase [Pyrobaculum arsenaticum]
MHNIVFVLQEVATKGFTVVYGPPGSGKTSVAAKMADRVANRIFWISTNESPGILKEVFMRVGAKAEKFYVFDFPRAFRGNVAKFIADHIHEYEALVVDAVTGIAAQEEKLEELVHGFLYQLAKDMPVVAVVEGTPKKIFYIADNLVKVSYKENALGHTVRYIKLVKSRFAPPSERYLFDFVEGVGLVYIYTPQRPQVAKIPLEEDAAILGINELYKSQIVGVFGKDKRSLARKLQEVAQSRELFYLSLFPPTTLPADLDENKVKIATTFKDLVETVYEIYSGRLKPRVFAVSGLRDVERIAGNDVVDYINAVASVAKYVDYILDFEIEAPGARIVDSFLDIKIEA